MQVGAGCPRGCKPKLAILVRGCPRLERCNLRELRDVTLNPLKSPLKTRLGRSASHGHLSPLLPCCDECCKIVCFCPPSAVGPSRRRCTNGELLTSATTVRTQWMARYVQHREQPANRFQGSGNICEVCKQRLETQEHPKKQQKI
jgi:hypothetical protein